MKLEVKLNDKKNGVELLFDRQPSAILSKRIEALGFKRSFHQDVKWYAKQHPALVEYAIALEKALFEGNDFLSIRLQPSFEPSEANIRGDKFSYVIIFHTQDGQIKRDSYVVFDSYKRVAADIAARFGRDKYKAAFKGVEIHARNYKTKAKILLEWGKIITGDKDRQSVSAMEKPSPLDKQPVPEITQEITKDFFDKTEAANGALQEAMPVMDMTTKLSDYKEKTTHTMPILRHYSKFNSNGTTGNHAASLVVAIPEPWTMTPLQYGKMKAIEKTGNPMPFDQRDMNFHEVAVKNALEDKKAVPREVLAHYPWLVDKKSKAHDPKQAEIDFETDKLKKFASFISENELIDGILYNGEIKATYQRLGKAALEQLAEYLGLKDYQVAFDKQHTGGSGKLSLMGMFTQEKGIYISLERNEINDGVHYRSINRMNDYKGGINHRFRESEFATPQTIREKVYRLLGIEKEEWEAHPTLIRYDYINQVVVKLHQMYSDTKQPTQEQIEQLKEELEVPNAGVMWEATELSWLLWYKDIYNEPLPFETRLGKMIRFWDTLQPTHAHRDSQMLYSQYSTPCPIAAMIAQYTEMDKAESIFDPSAGNGLLLLGADHRKTHVNEIDPVKTAALRIQGFRKITGDNAAEPFNDSMAKAYDVVVTNPPFARWEAAEAEKERIIKKYFGDHTGLAEHIRQEHLMAAMALHCMKDDGKAAIIITGHLCFSEDGRIAKWPFFFNWLYRHYLISDIINMDGKLYSKQGKIEKAMLILVNGRKYNPKDTAPQQHQAPHLAEVAGSFEQLWERIKPHIERPIDILIKQLKIELEGLGVTVNDQ